MEGIEEIDNFMFIYIYMRQHQTNCVFFIWDFFATFTYLFILCFDVSCGGCRESMDEDIVLGADEVDVVVTSTRPSLESKESVVCSS
jgi:hypothetical protein